jgi:hypothetical protein
VKVEFQVVGAAQRRESKIAPQALDESVRRRLWEDSERLTGMALDLDRLSRRTAARLIAACGRE